MPGSFFALFTSHFLHVIMRYYLQLEISTIWDDEKNRIFRWQ